MHGDNVSDLLRERDEEGGELLLDLVVELAQLRDACDLCDEPFELERDAVPVVRALLDDAEPALAEHARSQADLRPRDLGHLEVAVGLVQGIDLGPRVR